MPELQQGMAAGQQMLSVHVGDGAGGGNIHIAAHQNGAHGRAGLQRFRLFGVADRARAHHGDDSSGSELGAKSCMASSENPLKTSGVSMGFR